MAFLRWFILLALALTMLPEEGLGDLAVHWSIYKTSDGLAQPTYHALSLAPQGKLIAVCYGSTNGAELNGYSVSNFSLPTASIARVCESPGGQLWAETPDRLLESRKGVWVEHYKMSAGLDSAEPETVLQFMAVRQGCVVVLYTNGLVEFSTANPGLPQTTVICTSAQLKIGRFSGMALAADGGLWICGDDGAAKTTILVRNLTPAAEWQTVHVPKLMHLENLRNPEPDDDGGITFVAESDTNHHAAAVTFDGRQWTPRPAGLDFIWAWRGPGLTFWAATAESLFQWDDMHSNWVEYEEISPGQIFDVSVEPDGVFWLATRGELIRGSAPLWQRPGAIYDLDSEPQCIAEDSEKDICFIANNHVYILGSGSRRAFGIPGAPQNETANYSLFPLRNGSMLVQAGDALFQFQAAGGLIKPVFPPDAQPESALGVLPDGNICIYRSGTNSCFEEFDGTRTRPMTDTLTVDGSNAGFTALFTAQNGDLWIGGSQTGVLWRHGDQWHSFTSSESPGPESAVGFVEMPDGTILCATKKELWQYGKSWLLLQSGFNHINGLIRSHDGSIWVASNGGLFRFYKGAWLENAAGEDLPAGPIHAIFEDADSQLWAATTDGLRVFHPEADAGPPKTFLRSATDEGAQLPEGNTLDVLLEGQAKWKFTPSHRLFYSYQMDGAGWSPFQELTTLSFASLAAGRHSFQVCAMDAVGAVEPEPATLDFVVTVPWFKEGRLWIVFVAGAGVAIFFWVIALNRHRQLVLSHAEVERKVAERTRELEVATRELIHSQKMSALGTLAAGIAHDFNNILSIIKGSAQIIEDNLDAPQKILTRVDRIKTVVQQGAEIVDAMLGFSRGSNALPATCDINMVVAGTTQLLGDRFLREVDVKFERGENLPELLAPREFIQQILLNFIFNAAEAMSGRKEITLSTRLTEKLPADIFLAPAPSSSFVLVSVRDIGNGMTPEIVSRIFEPFFTTKGVGKGTGLGLATVYGVVKQSGGYIWVYS
ncbi:MAG TPA: ATP-binding protein, partial [Candidatus Acidoferrales bacterium]|nr:ATP-binding protein [Candidatus Acidoferrales bacterium]